MNTFNQFRQDATPRFRKRGVRLLCELYKLGNQEQFVGINFKRRAWNLLHGENPYTDNKTMLHAVEDMLKDNQRFWKAWNAADPKGGRPRKGNWSEDDANKLQRMIEKRLRWGRSFKDACISVAKAMRLGSTAKHVEFVKNQFHYERRKFNEIAASFDDLTCESSKTG